MPAETVADIYKVTRDAQDAYAARSQPASGGGDRSRHASGRTPTDHDPAEEGRSTRLSIATRLFDLKRRSRRLPD